MGSSNQVENQGAKQSNDLKPRLEHLQPSVLVIVIKLLAALFVLDTFYAFLVLGFFGLTNVHEWHDSYIFLLLLTHTAKYVLITVVIIKLFANWAGHTYYLTGHHLIERVGLINITETTYELSQVKSVILHQTWIGRRFNFGSINLSFAGATSEKQLVIRDVNDPRKFKQYFDEHLQVQGWVR